MKTRLWIILISIFFISLLSCRKEPKKIDLPRIEYDVLINNYGNNYSWFDHIDGFQRVDLFGLLLEQAKTGTYKLEDMDGNTIDPANIDSFFQLPPAGDNATEVVLPITKENLNGLRFREKWVVNKKTGFIEKEVIAVCPLHFRHHPLTDSSQFAEVFPLFWISPLERADHSQEMVVTKNIAYDVYLDNTLPFIEGAYGTKLPFYFFNIEASMRKEIINSIIDAAFMKNTPAYDYFMTPMNDQDMELLKEQTETVFYEDPDNPGIELDSVRVTTLDRTQIVRLKFIEEWTLNKTSLKFSKKVIAVSPSVISYDEYGEIRGYKFLFWLVFDKSRAQSLIFE